MGLHSVQGMGVSSPGWYFSVLQDVLQGSQHHVCSYVLAHTDERKTYHCCSHVGGLPTQTSVKTTAERPLLEQSLPACAVWPGLCLGQVN